MFFVRIRVSNHSAAFCLQPQIFRTKLVDPHKQYGASSALFGDHAEKVVERPWTMEFNRQTHGYKKYKSDKMVTITMVIVALNIPKNILYSGGSIQIYGLSKYQNDD